MLIAVRVAIGTAAYFRRNPNETSLLPTWIMFAVNPQTWSKRRVPTNRESYSRVWLLSCPSRVRPRISTQIAFSMFDADCLIGVIRSAYVENGRIATIPRRRIPGRIRFGSSTVPTSPHLSAAPRMKKAHSIPFLTGQSGPDAVSNSLDN